MREFLLAKRQENKAKASGQVVSTNTKSKKDLLAQLMENNTLLTDDEVFSDIFIFLVAGHETTAHTLGWALRYLAFNPDKQEKLHEEARQLLNGRDPTYDDYETLVYSRCVVKETLRLVPQVPSITKYNIEDVELRGYSIPVGTTLSFAVYSLHRNEQYWDRPEEFLPERFDPRIPNQKPIDPYAYIPFSAGRRACLGMKFAQVETALALAMIVKRYRIEVPKDVSADKLFSHIQLLTLQPAASVKLRLVTRS